MKFPLNGVFKRPLPWLLGLGAVLVLGVGIAIATIARNRNLSYDLTELTVPVEATQLTVRIIASGTVQPVQTVNLSPKNQGVLAELYVEQGDQVKRGQLIARMDQDDLEAQLAQNQATIAEAQAQLTNVQQGTESEQIAQAEAALVAAQAQVQESQARLDLAEQQLTRNRQLQAEGAISQNELDTFINDTRSAQASLNQARARAEEAQQRLAELRDEPDTEAVQQAQAQLERAQAQLAATEVRLNDTLITAPFDGIITQKFATEGAFVTPTTSASTATSATSTAIVALASGLEVVAEVPEADISRIFPGQRVEIVADAFPETSFQGRVFLIAPEAIERQDVTLFQVRIELLSGTDQLRSNMNVTVEFIGDELENALVVPTVAIVTQDGQTGVLVPDERKRIRFQPVTLGPQVADQIQILEGVQAGERVFVDLPPGQSLENLQFGRGSDS